MLADGYGQELFLGTEVVLICKIARIISHKDGPDADVEVEIYGTCSGTSQRITVPASACVKFKRDPEPRRKYGKGKPIRKPA